MASDASKAPVFAVLVENDLTAPMRDGTVLRADLYRPDAEGDFPVLLCRTPYDKARRVEHMFDAIAPSYRLVNTLASAGRDASWRRRGSRATPTAPGWRACPGS